MFYSQHEGNFYDERHSILATGYAGVPAFRNDPDRDHVTSKGPLPRGVYKMRLVDHPRFSPPAIALEAEPGFPTHGRSGFFIHGDNGSSTPSTGCIVLGLIARRKLVGMIQQGDNRLVVTR